MNNRDAWIEISVANIKYNIKQIQAKAGHSKLVGVIKADAYGHGAVNYAKALDEQGVDTFAVATIPEAIQLREAGFSRQQMIKVLGIAPEESIADILKYDIISVVCELSFAEKLSEAAAKIGKTANCMIAIDTGMGRIGYTHCDESTLVEIKKICSLKCLEIFGLLSHFATADAEDKGYAEEQHKKYDDFYAEITKSGVAVKNRILANSAAIMEMPGTHYDYVRPGIILYGILSVKGSGSKEAGSQASYDCKGEGYLFKNGRGRSQYRIWKNIQGSKCQTDRNTSCRICRRVASTLFQQRTRDRKWILWLRLSEMYAWINV